MDDSVIAAMAKWPNVPAAYGWLSLSENGQWRLHADGKAHQPCSDGTLPKGESIANQQIHTFINRNYSSDTQGRWFFQNGPQRVYVRLDAAPYVIEATPALQSLSLVTHTGQPVKRVTEWFMDDAGRLYAQTDQGPGIISGRDTPLLLDCLRTREGHPISTLPETEEAPPIEVTISLHYNNAVEHCLARLRVCSQENLPGLMHFQRIPLPSNSNEPDSRTAP